MCGFFGCFSAKSNIRNIKNIYKGYSLQHRGPDDHSYFSNKNLYCEFFRLEILGGKKGKQPMISRNKRFLILYNGEIYNYKELANDYLNIKKEEQELSDTRVLLELFSKFGLKAVEKFNGMFAIVLYDFKDKKIFLIRDRFGTKPLYYSISKDVVYFSSEIKGIPTKKEVNLNVVKDYLELGYYPNRKTFFSKIINLKPASFLIFGENLYKNQKYFNLYEQVKNEKQSNINSLEKFNFLLNNSIKIRQRSNRIINFHLSGGIDSNSLFLLTNKLWNKNYNLTASTYTYKGFFNNEYEVAKKICKKLNLKNFKVEISPKDIPDLAPKLQYYQDEPFGGLAAVSEYKQHLEQKKIGNIISFEGMGGDEILGGYNSHFYLVIRFLYYSNTNNVLLKKLVKYSGQSLKKILLISEKFILSGFNGNTDLSEIRLKKSKIKNKIYNFKNYYDLLSFKEINDGSLFRTLRFRDRSSAACGRELRFPFLDHNLLVHSMAIPLELKFKNGITKSPLREIVFKIDEKVAMERKKSVHSPQTSWFLNDLKDWAMDNINSLNYKKVIEKKYFLKVNNLFKPKVINTFYLWQLVNLNLFYENLKKNNLRND